VGAIAATTFAAAAAARTARRGRAARGAVEAQVGLEVVVGAVIIQIEVWVMRDVGLGALAAASSTATSSAGQAPTRPRPREPTRTGLIRPHRAIYGPQPRPRRRTNPCLPARAPPRAAMLAARRCAAQGRAARCDLPLRGATAPHLYLAAPRRAPPPPRAEPPPAAEAKAAPAAAAAASNSGYKADPDEPACYGTGAEVECILPEGLPADGGASTSAPVNLRSSRQKALDAALLVSPFFFWGTSMVAMKQLGPVTTPLALAAWRLVPAGGALLLWAAATGRRAPSGATAWAAIALFALADGAAFQGCLALGLQRTSAGLGSVIIDSQPLTVAVLAALLFGERLGAAGAAGLAAGVAGLALLEVPPDALAALLHGAPPGGITAATSAAAAIDVASTATPTSPPWSLWDSGEWWMLLAAQSMAVGTVMVRWVARYCDPVVATGWHMVLGGIPLAALAAYYEGPDIILGRLAAATPLDGALLAYVTLLGSAASYGIFFYEATTRGNLTALSSLTFLTPVFAAAGGFLALGETLAPTQLAGAAVTLGGVALLNAPKRERRAEAEALRRE
jgi:drug/metabolite transporter (DMT)-like permease